MRSEPYARAGAVEQAVQASGVKSAIFDAEVNGEIIQRICRQVSPRLSTRQKSSSWLRAELRRIHRRDYFPPVERDHAAAAVENLTTTVEQTEMSP